MKEERRKKFSFMILIKSIANLAWNNWLMITKFSKAKTLLTILLIVFQLSSCRASTLIENTMEFPNDPLVDKSFVTGQPCEAPCWYNLHLGISTVNDIRDTLVTLPFIDSSKTLEQKISRNVNEIMFLVYCTYGKSSEGCVYLETSPEGKLSRIFLSVYYSLTLSTITEKLGEPTYYISELRLSGGICEVTFYWIDNSVTAHADYPSTDNDCTKKEQEIQSDIQINGLVYGKITP